MLITSQVSFEANLMVFRASSSLSTGIANTEARFSISSDLFLTSESYSFGLTKLPSLTSIGGDISFVGYGKGKTLIPALFSSGNGGQYIPAELQTGSGYLPSLYSSGLLKTSSTGEGNTSLPSLKSNGGEGNYGKGFSMLLALISHGTEGTGSNIAEIMSLGHIVSGLAIYFEAIVFINSDGQIVDSISGTREVISSILESLSVDDSYSTIGNFLAYITETLTGSTFASGTIDDAIDLDSATRVWVVNIDSTASSQYDNYGYNSFIERDGISYGLAENGIFRLDGDTDNGTDIEALIDMGRSNFESTYKQSIPNVYVAASSDKNMLLKIEANGNSYIYEARSHTSSIQDNRVDPGKGLKSNYFNLTLLNKEGCDFDLESLTFTPVKLSRKI